MAENDAFCKNDLRNGDCKIGIFVGCTLLPLCSGTATFKQ